MWRKLRIIVLLMILVTVLKQTWLDKADLDWNDNFNVVVYPINADGTPEVDHYIKTLIRADFEPIAEYFSDEAKRFGLNMRRPMEVQLGARVERRPPVPPEAASALKTIIWSLKFRYYAWKNSPKVAVTPKIRMYLLYYDPAIHNRLGHSTALSKGRVGYVNLFGSQAYHKKNAVILSHEMLHTLGATDKYDLSTTLPVYPDGYAEPEKSPRYPQDFAELMGGRIPVSDTQAEIPKNLGQTLIGDKTAFEIGWLKSTLKSTGGK